MKRLSFAAVESFTAKVLRKWEDALLAGLQEVADRYRQQYLGMLESMGWTEQERDAEALKAIDEEWIRIYRCGTFRLAVTSYALH
jgi:hypothetical protein